VRLTVSGRGRFKIGWGLAWGIAVLAAEALIPQDLGNASTTVRAYAAPPLVPEPMRLPLLYAACALATGLGASLATSATVVSRGARWRIALVWSAIGLAVVAANFYLADHPGPDWWYESFARRADGSYRVHGQMAHRQPWMVHLSLTLAAAGALGGVVQARATSVAVGLRGLWHAVAWALLWSATFVFARYVGIIAVYLFGASVTDLFEAAGWPARIGSLSGTFLGGYLTGHIVGAIVSHSPGISWRVK
jgi:hypothetical protein